MEYFKTNLLTIGVMVGGLIWWGWSSGLTRGSPLGPTDQSVRHYQFVTKNGQVVRCETTTGQCEFAEVE